MSAGGLKLKRGEEGENDLLNLKRSRTLARSIKTQAYK